MEVSKRLTGVAIAAALGVGAGTVDAYFSGDGIKTHFPSAQEGGNEQVILLPSVVNDAEILLVYPDIPPEPTPGPEAYALCIEEEIQTNDIATKITRRHFDEKGRVYRRIAEYPDLQTTTITIGEIVYFEDGVPVRPIPEKPENFEGTFYVNYKFYEEDRLIRVDHDVTVVDGEAVAVESSDYFIYNDEGLLVRQEREIKGRAREPVVEYKYDDKGRRVEKKEQYNPQDESWAVIWHYIWDDTDDVIVREVKEGPRPRIIYNEYNQYSQVVRRVTYTPEGSLLGSVEYRYNKYGWLEEIRVTDETRSFPSITLYEYDSIGRLVNIIFRGQIDTQTTISRENCKTP